MDILLTHGYFLSEDETERRVMKPYAPMGILSLSAYLKREGIAVRVFDSTFETLDAFRQRIAETRPSAVGIYVNMMTKFSAIKMIRIAKEAGIRVVLGGPEPANYAFEFLHQGADAVVIGEGEETLTELLRCWESGGDISNVHGLVYLDDKGSIKRTPAREKIKDLDALPMPDRDAIDLQRYMDTWRGAHGYASLSLITMRGCPYTCKWCSHAVYGESYRRRSPALVADEIAYIMERYNPDQLWFADDVFTIHHRWLFDLEERLRKRNITIKFECITRADRLNHEVVSALKRMGCTRIWIGAESGSQRILDEMSRGVQVEQVEAMTKLCRAEGIEVGTFIMLGYTGEEKADIEQTVQYLRRSQPDIVLTTVTYPIKGTKYYNELNGTMVVPHAPFETWNDRNIDITGRYSRRFYRFASRRIVNETAAARMLHARHKEWQRIIPSWIKAKVAQVAMRVMA